MGEDKQYNAKDAPEKNPGVFTFNGQPVSPEAYGWQAFYSDGSSLLQFDGATMLFHRFSEIDQSRLRTFKMVSADGTKNLLLDFSEGMKLIHYYRNVCLQFGTPQEQRFKLYCFGYQKGDQKVIISIWPNGEVSVGENHPL